MFSRAAIVDMFSSAGDLILRMMYERRNVAQ